MNLDEFFKRYTSGDDAARVVYDDEIKKTASGESPFLILRSGDKVLVINPMAFADHISLDVHAFVDGEEAGLGMFGMTNGRRYEIETGLPAKSHGWDAVALATVLLGEQTTSDPTVVAATTLSNAALVEAANEAQALNEDDVEKVDKYWWEVDYRIVNTSGGPMSEGYGLVKTGTVGVNAEDEDDARYHAGLSDPAHGITEGHIFIIDAIRKI